MLRIIADKYEEAMPGKNKHFKASDPAWKGCLFNHILTYVKLESKMLNERYQHEEELDVYKCELEKEREINEFFASLLDSPEVTAVFKSKLKHLLKESKLTVVKGSESDGVKSYIKKDR
jgi:predicted GTPase